MNSSCLRSETLIRAALEDAKNSIVDAMCLEFVCTETCPFYFMRGNINDPAECRWRLVNENTVEKLAGILDEYRYAGEA